MAKILCLDEDSSPSTHHSSCSSNATHISEESEKFNLSLETVLNETSVDYCSLKIAKSCSELKSHVSSFDKLYAASYQKENNIKECVRKKARVGNHYQARIPRYISGLKRCIEAAADELLWTPFIMDSESVEKFLEQISSFTKLLLPMGNHLRDDEEALYILQKSKFDTNSAIKQLNENQTPNNNKITVWSEEECRNFERGLITFGKNFFLIQKYKVSSRHVNELVQFYYLWKKTERYDLFAQKIRGTKKKYALNPGMSDLMSRYLKKATKSNMELLINNKKENVLENNAQY